MVLRHAFVILVENRETGSKGKYVHHDSDCRTRSRSVFKARPGLIRTADLLAFQRCRTMQET